MNDPTELPSAQRRASIAALRDRIAPVALAAEQTLPVPGPLRPLFPSGGLAPGSTVRFQGAGSWTVALALAAELLGSEGWLAVLGVEELGLVAAAEAGVRLDRILTVESVAGHQLPAVAAALVEAVDVVVVAPRSPVGAVTARRLVARLREQGTVWFHLGGDRHWTVPFDHTVTAVSQRWEGVGEGHGHLRQRRLVVEAVGRRAATRPRRVEVVAPDTRGRLVAVEPGGSSSWPDRLDGLAGDPAPLARAG